MALIDDWVEYSINILDLVQCNNNLFVRMLYIVHITHAGYGVQVPNVRMCTFVLLLVSVEVLCVCVCVCARVCSHGSWISVHYSPSTFIFFFFVLKITDHKKIHMLLFSTLFKLTIPLPTVLSHHLPYRACATKSQSHAQHTLAVALSFSVQVT